MKQGIKRRVERLEQERKTLVTGVIWEEGYGVMCNGEEMTEDEFRRRYPEGTLIVITWTDAEKIGDFDK